MELINQKTGQPEEVPYEELGNKFLGGTHGIPKTQPVYLLSPDGSLDQYKSDSVFDAVNKGGYKFPTSGQVKEHENKAKYGNRPLATAALTGADAATFGMATRLGTATGYVSKEDAENLPKYNPAAGVLGTVAGIGGSLLLGPEAAALKMAGETLGLVKATGNVAKIAEAEEAYRKAKNTLTALDAINPVSAVSKIGEGTFDALAAVPEASSLTQKLTTKALAGSAQGAVEGGLYTLGEINREDALGNPNLNASHAWEELGKGVLFGGAGGAFVRGAMEAGKLGKSKYFPRGTFAEAVKDSVAEKTSGMAKSIEETVGPISMKSLDEIAAATSKFARPELEGGALPTMKEAIDISNRLPISLKPHAVQLESLRNPSARMKYDSFLERGDKFALAEQDLQAGQKRELQDLIGDTIKKISPDHTDDELAAGQRTAKKLDEVFSEQKSVLGPQFDKFDKAGSNLASKPEEILQSLNDRLPGVSRHMGVELTDEGYKIKLQPYSDILPYNQNVHRALGQIASALNREELSIGEIRSVARKLGAKLQKTSESYGSDKGVLSQIKGILSEHVAGEIDRIDPSVGARALNKEYAILKENEKTIKSMLGGSIEEGASYSKSINPTKVINNIFNPNDFNAVAAARKILPLKDFNDALASKLSMMVKDATDQQNKIFSSKKFSTLLNKNAAVLQEALKDNPQALQRIRDSATLMKILSDAGPVNTSRTAPVTFNLLKTLIHPSDELKNAVFGIKEHFANQTKEAVINQMLAHPGTTFEAAEAEVSKKWRAYNVFQKMNEASDKSNKIIISKSKNAFTEVEKLAKRAPGIAASKLATREEKQESHKELISKFDKASSKINMLVKNPDHMMRMLEKSTDGLSELAPKTGMALQSSLIKAAQFLDSKMPKKQTDGIFPEKLVPSQSDMSKFLGYVHTIEHPHSVLDSLKNNTISIDQIEAMSAVHPDMLDAMRIEIMNHIVGLKTPPPYQKKLSLSIFLGQDVDSSLKPQMINANQISFSMMKNGGSSQADAQGVKPTAKGLQGLNLADRTLMPMDKSASRRESK